MDLDVELPLDSGELIERAERLLMEGCSTAYGDRHFAASRPQNTVCRFRVWRVLVVSLIVVNVLAQDLSTVKTASRKEPKVVSVNLYSEKECVNAVSSIDWGALRPGVSRSVVVYAKNTGTEALTLHLCEENWNPGVAADYIRLQWNYSGDIVEAGDIVGITLVLTVSENVDSVSNFTFDILITGTEANGRERNAFKGKGRAKK